MVLILRLYSPVQIKHNQVPETFITCLALIRSEGGRQVRQPLGGRLERFRSAIQSLPVPHPDA